ncbi:Uncharacterised protein [Campylobacter hyointestinalis subsp. hyointestinalis]|uniref:Uncharacterized protein n=1 Tax=Campylobacter hyointestinalis subsp. hyointestinalis TaxID=91352 RepID=A0A0S4SNH9_CAMHY|nr:hypothetical protein [Campylobacter hyointestinalis]CUU87970.1 Uncharacterised protein [Campylobacter hyointestinalis subsp. hyointestinalis]
MGFLSKNLTYILTGSLTFGLVWLGLFCFNQSLQISKLKNQNKELSEQKVQLENDKATLKANLTSCDATLASQNEAIKAASVKIDNTPSKEVEQIKKIYVKDKGCEAELKAYKELFK